MWFSLVPLVIGVALQLGFTPLHKGAAELPPHLLHHHLLGVPDMLDPKTSADLLGLVKQLASYPTNTVADGKNGSFSSQLHEHIGEAVPTVNGSCAHPFLVPSADGSLCILPGRVDIGRHYILTGGVEGLKETYESLVSRVQSFGRYNFDMKKHPVVENLFRSGSFEEYAKAVCPKEQQHLDPFQYNFILQVPGQTVALHLDAPYYTRADRWTFPQWLLVAMTFSGLFQDEFIHQVQVVAYLHEWDPAGRAGDFVWYDENASGFGRPGTPLKVAPPNPRAGTAVDGSKLVHAAMAYMPEVSVPQMNPDLGHVLQYLGEGEGDGEQWELRDETGRTLERYTTGDLRISVVYRARCFADAQGAEGYKARGFGQGRGGRKDEDQMRLDEVLGLFAKELAAHGAVASAEAALGMDRLQLALLIMDTFIKYPFPDAAVPVNYCALGKLAPALAPVMGLVC